MIRLIALSVDGVNRETLNSPDGINSKREWGEGKEKRDENQLSQDNGKKKLKMKIEGI